jgi:hypothetical protein
MASTKQIILIAGVFPPCLLHPILTFLRANAGTSYNTPALLSSVPPSNHILMGVRSLTKGKKALTELQANSSQGAISLIQLDVTDHASLYRRSSD